MRRINANCLASPTGVSATGSTLDTNQWVSCSFHVYCADTTSGGTVKLQASNDIDAQQPIPGDFTVTNWVNLPSATASIASGAPALITVAQCNTRWLRVVYTASAGTAAVNCNVFALSV